MQCDCITNEVHVVAPLRCSFECNTTLFDQLRPSTARESCSYQLGPHGGACSSVVSKEVIVLTRNNCLQMAKKKLDLVVLAQINALRKPAAHKSPSAHGQLQEDFRCSNEVLSLRHTRVPRSIFVYSCHFENPLQEC